MCTIHFVTLKTQCNSGEIKLSQFNDVWKIYHIFIFFKYLQTLTVNLSVTSNIYIKVNQLKFLWLGSIYISE